VDQTTIQNLKVRFQTGSSGAVTQDQNTDTSCFPTTCATSSAVVRQNSFDQKNNARFINFNRPTASVRNANDNHDDEDDNDNGASNVGFTGSITQRQGKPGICPSEGLCGFEFQDSRGIQTAHELQDELKRLVAPKSLAPLCPAVPGTACQIQRGEEFCCATQTPGNDDNVNRVTLRKVGRHTHSAALLRAQGHCSSPNSPGSTAPKDNCVVDVTVIQSGNPQSPQTQHCVSDNCNVLIVCEQGGEGAGCTSANPSDVAPPRPPFPPGCIVCIDRPTLLSGLRR
jgi:hypothetical protein